MTLLRYLGNSRRKKSLLLLVILLILVVMYPPWNIFTACVRSSADPHLDDYEETFPLSLKTTQAPKIYQYHLKVFKHRVYKNADMITAMLGDKKGLDFMKRNTKDCDSESCPNRKQMEFLIPNVDACASHQRKFFLLIVYTATWNFGRREIVRKTWGTPNLISELASTTIFIIGTTKSNAHQAEITRESNKYNDIVQADFHDSYGNLSLKGRSYIQWASQHCPNASYIIKADDDQYLDIMQIGRIFTEFPLRTSFIFGHIKKGVIRRGSPGKKTNVIPEIFPGLEKYPTFFHGSTYVMSGGTVAALVAISHNTPIFQLDDVYMTGVLVGQIRGMTYYTYYAKKKKDKFQPTFPHLTKRMADVEDVRRTWCKHVHSIRNESPGILDEKTVYMSLGRSKCNSSTTEKHNS